MSLWCGCVKHLSDLHLVCMPETTEQDTNLTHNLLQRGMATLCSVAMTCSSHSLELRQGYQPALHSTSLRWAMQMKLPDSCSSCGR